MNLKVILKSKDKGILTIRLDHDSEFLSQGFLDYLTKNWIPFLRTPVKHHNQKCFENGEI